MKITIVSKPILQLRDTRTTCNQCYHHIQPSGGQCSLTPTISPVRLQICTIDGVIKGRARTRNQAQGKGCFRWHKSSLQTAGQQQSSRVCRLPVMRSLRRAVSKKTREAHYVQANRDHSEDGRSKCLLDVLVTDHEDAPEHCRSPKIQCVG